ncbi:MAG: hypothetical protein U1E65_20955 [Myxococcota bacterium]
MRIPWPFLLLVGCGTPVTGLGPGMGSPDAGTPVDSGAPDAAPSLDAEPSPDAGFTDAEAMDSANGDAAWSPLRPCGFLGIPRIRALHVSPDGSTIAMGTAGGEILLVRASDGLILRRFGAHAGPVHDVIYSPDGLSLYSYGQDAILRAFSASDGSPRWTSGVRRNREASRVAANADQVVVGGNSVDVYDARSGAVLKSLSDPALNGVLLFAPAAVAVSRDGSHIAAAYGSTAIVFAADGAVERSLSGDLGTTVLAPYEPEIVGLAFSPDQRSILMAVRRAYFSTPDTPTAYNVARAYELSDGSVRFTLTASSSYGVTAAWASDGQQVLVGGGGSIERWNLSDGSKHRLPIRADDVVSGPGDLVVGNLPGVGVTAVRGDQPLFQAMVGDVEAQTLAVSNDGRLLLRSVEHLDSTSPLELWSQTPGADGPESLLLTGFERAGPIADLSPDGAHVAIFTGEAVEIRSVEAGQIETTIPHQDAPVYALSFDANSHTLLIATATSVRLQPRVLQQVDLTGQPLAERRLVGAVGSLRRTDDGWITSGPNRDHFNGRTTVGFFLNDGQLSERFSTHVETWGPDAAELSPNQDALWVAQWTGPVLGFAIPGGASLPLPDRSATRLRLSPTKDILVRAESEGRLLAGPPTLGMEAGTEFEPAASDYGLKETTRLVFSPTGEVLYQATNQGELRLFCRTPTH